MTIIEFFKIVCEDINSAVVAATDKNNLPVTCVINIPANKAEINQTNFLHCGNRFEAVKKRG